MFFRVIITGSLMNNQTSVWSTSNNRGTNGVYVGPDGIGLGNGVLGIESDGSIETYGPMRIGRLKDDGGTAIFFDADPTSSTLTLGGNIILDGIISWNTTNSPVQTLYASKELDKPTRKWLNDDGAYSYPESSTNGWHRKLQANREEYGNLDPDYYASYTYDGGTTWTDAVKIQTDDVALPDYLKQTYISSTEIRSPEIIGGTITGMTLQTAKPDNGDTPYITITKNGIGSYTSTGLENGLFSYPSNDRDFNTGLAFYSQGSKLFSVERAVNNLIVNFNAVSAGGAVSVGSLIASGAGQYMMVDGTWDFSTADVIFSPSRVTGIKAKFG